MSENKSTGDGLFYIAKAIATIGILAVAAYMGINDVEYYGWLIFLAFLIWM